MKTISSGKVIGARRVMGGYSAIVKVQETDVWAENEYGGTIAEGEAGVDDASVIKSAATEIGEGKIFIARGTYKLIQKISCPAGIFIESEGAELDISGLNDVAFEFGNDTQLVYDKLTGLKGFKVTGSSTNTNTLLVRASQIVKGFVLEKIIHKNLNNLVEVRGACYDATIRDCWGKNLKGTWIKLVTVDLDGKPYKPNGTEIINCELSNSWADVGGTGIEIYSSNEDTSVSGAVGTVKIHNVWLEALNVGIYSEARSTIISNCPLISAVDKGIHINTKYVDSTPINESGRGAQIIGNLISVPQSSSYGIYLDGLPYEHIISANFFRDVHGVAIYCTNKQYIAVIGNIFSIMSDSAVGVSGVTNYSRIIGNSFIGSVPSPRGTGIDASGDFIIISSNTFAGLNYPINATSLNWVYDASNIFYGNANNPVFGTKYKNSGTKTLSGDGTTTDFEIGAHGLAVTDPNKIVVKVTPISADAIAASPCIGYVDPADNTKIRVKFASAPASGTDNVKIAWKAEVTSSPD